MGILNFYPRSPCGERRQAKGLTDPAAAISIHALLAESDIISIAHIIHSLLFLSTLSLRRATVAGGCAERSCKDFYPRSPCGERHHKYIGNIRKANFYPRSPCGERPPQGCFTLWEVLFLSTLSLRRATFEYIQAGTGILFLSTLSLRRATELIDKRCKFS